MATFGERLKELRTSHNLTQADIAKIALISDRQVIRFERDVNSPNANIVMALANYFGVSSDYLLGLSEELPIDSADEITAILTNNRKLADSFISLTNMYFDKPDIDIEGRQTMLMALNNLNDYLLSEIKGMSPKHAEETKQLVRRNNDAIMKITASMQAALSSGVEPESNIE